MNKDFKPTTQQQAILDAFMEAKPMIVQAGAGTGKTTTLQMLAESTDDIGLYIAFNRSVAAEARGRFPDTVDAVTAHALAKRTLEKDDYWRDVIKAKFSAQSSESGKAIYDTIIYPIYPHEDDNYFRLHPSLKIATGIKDRPYLYYANWAQLVTATVKKFCQSADDEITAEHFNPLVAARSINRHNVKAVSKQLFSNLMILERTLELARKYWSRIIDPEDRKVAFGFDHILKVWQLSKPELDYDYVMFDEAQDANATLSHVVLAQHKFGTQIVVVGDQNQAIYGFTGSLDAMKKFEEAVPEAIVLPLTESWRFGAPVADAANQVLFSKGVPERITGLSKDTQPLHENYTSIDFVEEGIDTVLCRSNTGCLEAAFWVMANYPDLKINISVNLREMKEFYEAALVFQTTGKTKYPTMKDFNSFADFVTAVSEDSTLGMEFGLLLRTATNAGGVKAALDMVSKVERASSNNSSADLTISTVHQSKGAEWDNVLLYDDWVGGLNSDEEKNLLYVATTRAKKNLYTGGFWTVYRHGVHITQEQAVTMMTKIFSGDPDDVTFEAAESVPTLVVTKEDFTLPDGRKGCFEYRADRTTAHTEWTGVTEKDILGVKVYGVDMIHRGVYVPVHSSIDLDISFMTLKREDIDTIYTDPVEKVIAQISMDARDALEASERPFTFDEFASAVSLLKVLIRDETGRVGTFLESSKAFPDEDRARVALCSTLIDCMNHSRPVVAGRTPSDRLSGLKEQVANPVV